MTYINETTIPRDGLVAEYLLDGNANDTAGSNNGTATNVTWVGADRGYVEEVGSFNGSSSQVDSLSNITLDSISLWIKPDAEITTADSKGLASRGADAFGIRLGNVTGNATNEMILITDGGNLDISYWNNATVGNITTDWHHIVILHEGGTNYRLYYDNVDLGLGIVFGTPGQISLSRFGRFRNETSAFDGNIGIIRMYNSTLSQEEITNLYNEGLRKLGPTNSIQSNGFPLYSLPNLEEGKVLEISRPQSGGVYVDQTGNGNNGTPTSITDSANGLNNVMSFNGSASKLDTNYTLSSTTSSISFNYKHTTTGDDTFILSQGYKPTTLDGRWGLQIKSDNTLLLFQNPGNLLQITSSALTVGQNYLITINRTSNNDWELFINGVSQGTASNGISLPAQSLVFMELAGTYRGGELSNIDIYNRALSPTEIQQLYYSSKLI